MTIYYVDRKTGDKKVEVVAGDNILKWTYDTKPGKLALETIMKRKLLTKVSGKIMDTPYSKHRIAKFIRELDIDLSEAQRENINEYKDFNDFFARELKVEARPICKDEDSLIAPADGRVFAYENINIDEMVQIKGSHFKLEDLFQDEAYAKEYNDGVCIIVRLAPFDYHRFHFPASGTPGETKQIKGHYYSVNPYALRKIAGIYCQNKREITQLSTLQFGKIALVEVGATCVGSIIQTYEPNKPIEKGTEKGYFKFGGSTTVIFIKKGFVKVDEDIISNTHQGVETKVNMGESIGRKK